MQPIRITTLKEYQDLITNQQEPPVILACLEFKPFFFPRYHIKYYTELARVIPSKFGKFYMFDAEDIPELIDELKINRVPSIHVFSYGKDIMWFSDAKEQIWEIYKCLRDEYQNGIEQFRQPFQFDYTDAYLTARLAPIPE